MAVRKPKPQQKIADLQARIDRGAKELEDKIQLLIRENEKLQRANEELRSRLDEDDTPEYTIGQRVWVAAIVSRHVDLRGRGVRVIALNDADDESDEDNAPNYLDVPCCDVRAEPPVPESEDDAPVPTLNEYRPYDEDKLDKDDKILVEMIVSYDMDFEDPPVVEAYNNELLPRQKGPFTVPLAEVIGFRRKRDKKKRPN